MFTVTKYASNSSNLLLARVLLYKAMQFVLDYTVCISNLEEPQLCN